MVPRAGGSVCGGPQASMCGAIGPRAGNICGGPRAAACTYMDQDADPAADQVTINMHAH